MIRFIISSVFVTNLKIRSLFMFLSLKQFFLIEITFNSSGHPERDVHRNGRNSDRTRESEAG